MEKKQNDPMIHHDLFWQFKEAIEVFFPARTVFF